LPPGSAAGPLAVRGQEHVAPESFSSTLEHEVLSHHFTTKTQARSEVLAWCHEFYYTHRRHSSAAMMAPIDYEHTAAQPADEQEAAW
jgi:putative transposase